MKPVGCLIPFSSPPHNFQSTPGYQYWCVCAKLALRANRWHRPGLCPQLQRLFGPQWLSLQFSKQANLVRCDLVGHDSPTPFGWWGSQLHTIIMLESTSQEVQEFNSDSSVTSIMAKEECVQKFLHKVWSLGVLWLESKPGSSRGCGELQALFALSPWAIFGN